MLSRASAEKHTTHYHRKKSSLFVILLTLLGLALFIFVTTNINNPNSRQITSTRAATQEISGGGGVVLQEVAGVNLNLAELGNNAYRITAGDSCNPTSGKLESGANGRVMIRGGLVSCEKIPARTTYSDTDLEAIRQSSARCYLWSINAGNGSIDFQDYKDSLDEDLNCYRYTSTCSTAQKATSKARLLKLVKAGMINDFDNFLGTKEYSNFIKISDVLPNGSCSGFGDGTDINHPTVVYAGNPVRGNKINNCSNLYSKPGDLTDEKCIINNDQSGAIIKNLQDLLICPNSYWVAHDTNNGGSVNSCRVELACPSGSTLQGFIQLAPYCKADKIPTQTQQIPTPIPEQPPADTSPTQYAVSIRHEEFVNGSSQKIISSNLSTYIEYVSDGQTKYDELNYDSNWSQVYWIDQGSTLQISPMKNGTLITKDDPDFLYQIVDSNSNKDITLYTPIENIGIIVQYSEKQQETNTNICSGCLVNGECVEVIPDYYEITHQDADYNPVCEPVTCYDQSATSVKKDSNNNPNDYPKKLGPGSYLETSDASSNDYFCVNTVFCGIDQIIDGQDGVSYSCITKPQEQNPIIRCGDGLNEGESCNPQALGDGESQEGFGGKCITYNNVLQCLETCDSKLSETSYIDLSNTACNTNNKVANSQFGGNIDDLYDGYCTAPSTNIYGALPGSCIKDDQNPQPGNKFTCADYDGNGVLDDPAAKDTQCTGTGAGELDFTYTSEKVCDGAGSCVQISRCDGNNAQKIPLGSSCDPYSSSNNQAGVGGICKNVNGIASCVIACDTLKDGFGNTLNSGYWNGMDCYNGNSSSDSNIIVGDAYFTSGLIPNGTCQNNSCIVKKTVRCGTGLSNGANCDPTVGESGDQTGFGGMCIVSSGTWKCVETCNSKESENTYKDNGGLGCDLNTGEITVPYNGVCTSPTTTGGKCVKPTCTNIDGNGQNAPEGTACKSTTDPSLILDDTVSKYACDSVGSCTLGTPISPDPCKDANRYCAQYQPTGLNGIMNCNPLKECPLGTVCGTDKMTCINACPTSDTDKYCAGSTFTSTKVNNIECTGTKSLCQYGCTNSPNPGTCIPKPTCVAGPYECSNCAENTICTTPLGYNGKGVCKPGIVATGDNLGLPDWLSAFANGLNVLSDTVQDIPMICVPNPAPAPKCGAPNSCTNCNDGTQCVASGKQGLCNKGTCTIPPVCPNKNKGDANCDNLINCTDKSIWKAQFGKNISTYPDNNRADFNGTSMNGLKGDGIANLTDYEIWRANFNDGLACYPPGTDPACL